MIYTVKWHPKAREFLRKCDKIVSERIVKKVDKIRNDPIPHLDYFPKNKVFKLRVGDWRVLMDVDQKNKLMEILLIDHRKRIYKKI